MKTVSLYDAKTHLSSLIAEAVPGEEIVIAEDGVARAVLVPVDVQPEAGKRRPTRSLKVTYMADDFDAPDPEIAALFEGAGCDDGAEVAA